MKYAKIVSEEQKFVRLLSLELADIGVRVTEDLDEYIDEAQELFVVADLDYCNTDELKEYAFKYKLIGYSFFSEVGAIEKSSVCPFTFKRPFLMSEFLAVFGKDDSYRHVSEKSRPTKKTNNFLSVDKDNKCAVWGDVKIPLSDNEIKILSLLCDNRGSVVRRNSIYSLLDAHGGNMGDVYVCHLRKKIDNKLGLKLIYTIRGEGYMIKI